LRRDTDTKSSQSGYVEGNRLGHPGRSPDSPSAVYFWQPSPLQRQLIPGFAFLPVHVQGKRLSMLRLNDVRVLEDFLGDDYWYIASDRHKTKSACLELLYRLPKQLARYLISRSEVALIAPGAGDLGLSRSLEFHVRRQQFQPANRADSVMEFPSNAGQVADQTIDLSTSLIYLSPRLEELNDIGPIVAVAALEIVRSLSLAGQGNDAVREADKLLRQWGFEKELDELRRVNP
jgi:hypothetical protein